MIETNRRSLITGLISLVAAPAIVRATSIMSVRAAPLALDPIYLYRCVVTGHSATSDDGILTLTTTYRGFAAGGKTVEWTTSFTYDPGAVVQ